jgi:ATP-dependent DNA helicase PIF1
VLINYAFSFQIKVDARVLIVRNVDVDLGITNGTVGFVRAIGDKLKYLIIEIDGTKEMAFIRPVKQKLTSKSGRSYYRVQFPILLGYALTVHRVQGMTLPKVYVSLDNYFAPGQVCRQFTNYLF